MRTLPEPPAGELRRLRPRVALALLVLIACTAGPAVAQLVAVETSLNPSPPGIPITVTLRESLGAGITLPTSCVFASVRAGAPGGPVVFVPGCLQVATPVVPCGTRADVWHQLDDLGNQVPPGDYWFEVRYFDLSFNGPFVQWFCVQIVADPAAASLSAAGDLRVGQTTSLFLAAPRHPNGLYVAVASLTTSTGIVIAPGLRLCTDQDPVFAASFPHPDPTAFGAFQGMLDPGGFASAITVTLPGLPAIACFPLHVQAVVATVMGSTASVEVTNVVNFIIRP